jgi:dsDNA-specific endonuclease/ATPase MutS2
MRHILSVFFGLLLIVCSCGKADLAVLNDVNIFSPKWQEVSQQYAFVKRNLETALVLYEEHLQDLEPQIEQASAARRPELIGLRGRYEAMVGEAQELQGDYKEQYAELKETVVSFNDWQTKLMNNKFSNAEARADFATYKVNYRNIKAQATELQSSLIKNVENHNNLTSAMVDLLGGYQNYRIELR